MIDETLAKAGRQRPAQIAVSSFGQIVDLLQHSDHAAVIAIGCGRAVTQG